ncbi:MAG: hypothetical protein GY898_19430 [Proteobacteria bacterium]|nr:hypothetical protein [Pseudomonadota bacterium]
MRWLPLLLLVAACSTTPLPSDLVEVDVATFPVVEGSPQAVGLLALVNDPATTLTVLDDEVPLNRRAAESIIAGRPFDTIAELDAAYYVGPAALNALVAYATAQNLVPSGNDVLGTWDGVEFTVAQADLLLEIVINDLDYTDFDVYIDLDSRAATSIVAAQPVASVAELAGLYYVGTSALTKLKAEAAEMMGDEWPVCVPNFTVTANSAAQDLTALLAIATTVDNPWAEIISLQADGCTDWWQTTDDDVTAPIWNEIFFISWNQFGPDLQDVGTWTVGDAGYTGMLNLTLTVIEENIEDGDFDPAQAQELYDARFDLVDELSVDLDTTPGVYRTLDLEMDMSECSEEAMVLLDTRDGSILIVHQLQNC